MKEDLFDDIIRKFLTGRATPHEREMLSRWLKENPSRDEAFYLHVSRRERESPQYLPEMDSKITAYEEFLRNGTRPSVGGYAMPESLRTPRMNYRWLLAACLLLLAVASYYFVSTASFYRTYTADQGLIRTVAFHDGTLVTLNANSSLKVRCDWMGEEAREVWVQGEAFFEVTRQLDLSRFIVHTDNFDVEVLGTKFNVNNRRGKSEVVLIEGKVKVVKKDEEPLIMKPGEQVVIEESEDHFKKKVVEPEKYSAWRNNLLVFEDTPLSEVGEIIFDYYGVPVIVTDSVLASRKFTGTLPNNDLDVILLSLRTAYKIEVDRTEDQIVLKPQ